jgi:hypothetical protein
MPSPLLENINLKKSRKSRGSRRSLTKMRQHDFWGRLTKVVEVVGAMSNLDQFGVRYKNKPLSPQTLHRTCLKRTD